MPDNMLTSTIAPGGGDVINYDYPPDGYPSDFDPVTKLTECPMWPDCSGCCPGGSGGPATAESMTSAERMADVLEAGKLVWDTDLQLLYVGDGTTLGGVLVEDGGSADFTRVVFHDKADN